MTVMTVVPASNQSPSSISTLATHAIEIGIGFGILEGFLRSRFLQFEQFQLTLVPRQIRGVDICLDRSKTVPLGSIVHREQQITLLELLTDRHIYAGDCSVGPHIDVLRIVRFQIAVDIDRHIIRAGIHDRIGGRSHRRLLGRRSLPVHEEIGAARTDNDDAQPDDDFPPPASSLLPFHRQPDFLFLIDS
jgi:hypothetical protein